MLPVTVFELITGGALQKIGEFDNQAEASAAAGIPGKTQKNGLTAYHAVSRQLTYPTKEPSKAAASSSGKSYYFIYTFQLGCAITDVDIKAELDLRGTAAAHSNGAEGLAPQSSWCVAEGLLPPGSCRRQLIPCRVGGAGIRLRWRWRWFWPRSLLVWSMYGPSRRGVGGVLQQLATSIARSRTD
jgi:hypothetical protein